MKKYIFLILSGIICAFSLSAYQVKQASTAGKVGSGIGKGFVEGLENYNKQQNQLQLLERERQIQMEILERQRQIQLELLENAR